MAILGRMEGRERASIVLPLPGGPFMIKFITQSHNRITL
jgi:hypothetical protein